MKRCVSVAAMLLFLIWLWNGASMTPKETSMVLSEAVEIVKIADIKLDAGVVAAIREQIFDEEKIPTDLQVVYLSPEEEAALVYTFLQGPRAFREQRPWSGEWCQQMVKGNSFGGFGCGFCCMANIYSTLTDYECSPWDMFTFAAQVTYYYPTRKSGAIGWEDLQSTLRAAGMQCRVYQKPETYEEFKEQIKKAKSAIVLVSSANDDTFWKDTSGHYVNIWLYQENTDMVFLAEPGNPENNRTWIPLHYVYDALKTISQYQYLTVTSYSEEDNNWKWNGIDDNWYGKY